MKTTLRITILKFTIMAIFPLTLLAQSTPNRNFPTTVSPLSNGNVVLHAITAKATGTEIAYMPEWQAFGWFRADGVVEWKARIKKGGRYQVFLEWSVSDEEAGKEFLFESKRGTIKGVVEKSGSWETYKKTLIGELSLSKGRQTFRFKPAIDFGSGALLDLRSIELVPIP